MSRKAKIIISDTHIGAGGAAEGNKLEDFISDAEFVQWIHELVEESNREDIDMELIINGDWIEFLQIPAVDQFEPHHLYDTSYYVDASEMEALQRLEVVYEWHPSIFLGMSDFMHAALPRRSITILFGNHDPEIAYPSVQARMRDMVNAVGEDAELFEIGERSYCRDRVYIEHGNAYVEQINRFSDPDSPFDPNDLGTVERPAGSHFVTHFFNQVEWQRAWVDGVHPMSTLIFYAIAFEPEFAVDVITAFLQAAPDIVLEVAIAQDERPVISARDKLEIQLATPEQRAEVVRKLQVDPDFSAAFTADVAQLLIEGGALPVPERGIAGIPSDEAPELRASSITSHYWRMLEEAADEIAQEKGAQIVLFGHIHDPVDITLPSGAKYLNTGTWAGKLDFSNASDEMWQDLINHPERYMFKRTLTYARIDFDEDGSMVHAGLQSANEDTTPDPDPEPQPDPGWWANLLLSLKNFFGGLFG